jgi:antirestriction protein ArdC/phage/plasmid primase-like uncharacterized protein
MSKTKPKNTATDKVSEFRQELVNNIIAELEKGEIPWHKPLAFGLMNAATGNNYKGGNVLSLAFAMQQNGFTDPRFCTFVQAQENGWKIKPGSKSAKIEYWQWDKKEKVLDVNGNPLLNEKGKEVTKTVPLQHPIARIYHVFNAEQIEGIPPYEKQSSQWKGVESAETILKNSGARITHKLGDEAFCRPSTDEIVLPSKEQFVSAEGYYGTALHELSHWTGNEKRLNRDLSGKFGSPEYAKEELRAELASAFINAELGTRKEFSETSAYIQFWIEALQKDKNEIFHAAADADKIANYIFEFAKEKEITQEQAADTSGTPTKEEAVRDTDKNARQGQEGINNMAENDKTAEKQAANTAGAPVERKYVETETTKKAKEREQQRIEIAGKLVKAEECYKAAYKAYNDLQDEYMTKLENTKGQKAKLWAEYGQKFKQAEQEWGIASKEQRKHFNALSSSIVKGWGGKSGATVNNPGWKKFFNSEIEKYKNMAKENPVRDTDKNARQGQEGVKNMAENDKTAEKQAANTAGAPVERNVDPNEISGEETKKMRDIANGKPAPCDIRLVVNFDERVPAKELGGKWDADAKTWYVPKGEDLSKFTAYLPTKGNLYALQDTPLPNVKFTEKDTIKALGAFWNAETKSWYVPKGADVSKFDQRYFEPAPEKVKSAPAKTFEEFAAGKGLIINGAAVAGGEMQRVPVEGGKPGRKDGAYLLYDDDKGRSGWVKNFKTGEEASFAENGKTYTLSDKDRAEITKAAEERKAEIKTKQDIVAKKAEYLVKNVFTRADRNNQYLQDKGVLPHGTLKDMEGKLIIPMQNVDGETRSFQVIENDGRKSFIADGQKSGCFHAIGLTSKAKPKEIIICEGYSTGASINEASKKPVLCAMDAGNLKSVAVAVREKYGEKVDIIIAGDNDHKTENNPGRTAAENAAKAVNGKVITPEFTPKEKEQGLSDFNDLAKSRGKEAVKEQLSSVVKISKERENELAI